MEDKNTKFVIAISLLIVIGILNWISENVATTLVTIAFFAFVAVMVYLWRSDENQPPSPPTPPNTGSDPYEQ